MTTLKGKPLWGWVLLAVGLVLVIVPALPWYHFSPFRFSLGVAGAAIALYDMLRT